MSYYRESVRSEILKFLFDNDKMAYTEPTKEMNMLDISTDIWVDIDSHFWGSVATLVEDAYAVPLKLVVEDEL